MWEHFGDISNYIEPFYGSGAVLLQRPQPFKGVETVNDKDGLLSNFWRAIKCNPEETAYWADYPVNENDLTARHLWLVNNKDKLVQQLESDPDYYDTKIAGWWVWGISCWIGSGWCSGEGCWKSKTLEDGTKKLVKGGGGVKKQRPHLGENGVHKKLPLLSGNMGVHRKLPHMGGGKGVNRQMPTMRHELDINKQEAGGGKGVQGIHQKIDSLTDYFIALANRLRNVRVCCGDWLRICGASPTIKQNGITGVFLDPPYGDDAMRQSSLYREDSGSVAALVRKWALAADGHPKLRIALCGYQKEHLMPDSWKCVLWEATGGYGNQKKNRLTKDNRLRECIWFSPNCVKVDE